MESRIKAIFIDHMGTIVTENSKYAKEVIKRTYLGSKASSPEEIAGFWFKTSDELIEEAYGNNFKTVYEISLESFKLTDKKYDIKEKPEELCKILERNWIFSPAFEDTKEFFEKCPVPIYLLSNNDDKYIGKAVDYIGINPAGIITSEIARAYKPRREIFEKALEICRCKPSEVIHIGDSIRNDILGAQAVGIEAWLLDRNDRNKDQNLKSFSSLLEVLDEIIGRMD